MSGNFFMLPKCDQRSKVNFGSGADRGNTDAGAPPSDSIESLPSSVPGLTLFFKLPRFLSELSAFPSGYPFSGSFPRTFAPEHAVEA